MAYYGIEYCSCTYYPDTSLRGVRPNALPANLFAITWSLGYLVWYPTTKKTEVL